MHVIDLAMSAKPSHAYVICITLQKLKYQREGVMSMHIAKTSTENDIGMTVSSNMHYSSKVKKVSL